MAWLNPSRMTFLFIVLLVLAGLSTNRSSAQVTVAVDSGPFEWISALAIDPQDSRRLYAGTRFGIYFEHG